MKILDTIYIMFTVWGCCFFGSTKVSKHHSISDWFWFFTFFFFLLVFNYPSNDLQDPFYDGEQYRKDGGDGTVHWYYEKVYDIVFISSEFGFQIYNNSWFVGLTARRYRGNCQRRAMERGTYRRNREESWQFERARRGYQVVRTCMKIIHCL